MIYNGVTDWLYEGMVNTLDGNDVYFKFFRGSFVHRQPVQFGSLQGCPYLCLPVLMTVWCLNTSFQA